MEKSKNKQFDKENYNAFITDIRQEYNEWLESRNAQTYITEAGQIESWSTGKTSEELSKEFEKTIAKAKEQRDDKSKY